jgi:hypothetical protein
MTYLKYAAYVIFALAAVNLILAISEEDWMLFVVAFATTFTGLAFLGASEALGYLRDIRDALVPAKQIEVSKASEPMVEAEPAPLPVRSAAEIAADIDRLKAKR